MKTRKLSDLYVRGAYKELSDGQGTPVRVWIQKLNPIEQEKALRKANALRSSVFTDTKNEESELFLSTLAEAQSLTRDELLDRLAQEEVGRKRLEIEAEVESEEKWAKDGYLQGLYDAWNEGLKDSYAEDPENPDARKVFDAMTEFQAEVEKAVERNLRYFREEFETQPTEKLTKKATEQTLSQRVDLLWMAEYRRCQVWLSVRDPESHKSLYFNSRAEVDDLAQETLIELIGAYVDLEVDGIEGKGSAETQDSSSSSEPPAVEETVVVSGL